MTLVGRFGKVKNCEVIRDQKTGDSLQYAFVEFFDQAACEQAYFKMDNVLIGRSFTKQFWLGLAPLFVVLILKVR